MGTTRHGTAALVLIAILAACGPRVENVETVAASLPGVWEERGSGIAFVDRNGVEEIRLTCRPSGLSVFRAVVVPVGRPALIDVSVDTGAQFAVAGVGTPAGLGVEGAALLPEVFAQGFANARRITVAVAGRTPFTAPLSPAARAVMMDC